MEKTTISQRKKILKKYVNDINIFLPNIGKKVVKHTLNPFKSTYQKNTIKGVIEHPILKNKLAYIFFEDDSYVSVLDCKIID